MKLPQRTLVLLTVLALLAGCAAAPPVAEQRIVIAKPAAQPIAKEAPPPASRPTEECDLLTEGAGLLNQSDRPEMAKARGVFVGLIERYPQGRCRAAAEAFIRLIDEIAALRQEIRWDRLMTEQIRTERTGAMRENETLNRKVQELTERLLTETAALAQENERLKRDLGRLKALEVELEKRERLLR
ncbi:MAG: hypothetical protein ACYC7J_11015 [Syntrophales bacterium]